MSSASPTKTTSTRLFSKNIRLNFNSKFLPQDFFPESISQFSKTRKNSEKENQYRLSRKQSSDEQNNEDHAELQKQALNFQLLKKRLVKIKESSPSSGESGSMKKASLKNGELSRKKLRKSIEKQRDCSRVQGEEKNTPKGYSRKLMDYMKKMKDVINIDIKFQQDLSSPVYPRQCREPVKYNPQQVQTDDSPRIQRFRPKSEINSRQRLLSKEKANLQSKKVTTKPLKIKTKQTSKLMKESRQKSEQKQRTVTHKKSERYNKFIDIQLNEEGMLTFYGSPDQKQNQKNSYDCRKYSVRSSLPRLQK